MHRGIKMCAVIPLRITLWKISEYWTCIFASFVRKCTKYAHYFCSFCKRVDYQHTTRLMHLFTMKLSTGMPYIFACNEIHDNRIKFGFRTRSFARQLKKNAIEIFDSSRVCCNNIMCSLGGANNVRSNCEYSCIHCFGCRKIPYFTLHVAALNEQFSLVPLYNTPIYSQQCSVMWSAQAHFFAYFEYTYKWKHFEMPDCARAIQTCFCLSLWFWQSFSSYNERMSLNHDGISVR